MEEQRTKGMFYDRAHKHCLSIGFDTTKYCGIMNGYSYYYLDDSTRQKGYYGTYIIKFKNSDGAFSAVLDGHEILKAYNMLQ